MRTRLGFCVLALLLATALQAASADGATYRFNRTISREVLVNYLSRAVTHFGLCSSCPEPPTDCFDDDLRMLTRLGAKFVGRAAYAWTAPEDDEAHFRLAQERAEKVHRADPDILLQACIFEAVYEGVKHIPVPDWAFEEFGQPPVKRNFDYEAMLYDEGKFRNHWTQGASVPDMSRPETRRWFFYRARRYLDAGFEAIHFGQVHLMDQNDPNHRHWLDLLGRIRRYAARNARRHLVLCDAHTHGIVREGLMFDFHAWPLRIKEKAEAPQRGELAMGYGDVIYGHSLGGFAPSGWYTANLPYLVEFDNFGSSGKGGQAGLGLPWIWGYDEISWFARQGEAYRNDWLSYAFDWLKKHDPDGHLQMPTRRVLADPVNGVAMYHANRRSPACPNGFNQEETIKAIWEADARSRRR